MNRAPSQAVSRVDLAQIVTEAQATHPEMEIRLRPDVTRNEWVADGHSVIEVTMRAGFHLFVNPRAPDDAHYVRQDLEEAIRRHGTLLSAQARENLQLALDVQNRRDEGFVQFTGDSWLSTFQPGAERIGPEVSPVTRSLVTTPQTMNMEHPGRAPRASAPPPAPSIGRSLWQILDEDVEE